MKKNMLLAVFVIVLCVLGCAPKAEHGASTEGGGEALYAEDFEDGNEVPEVPPVGSLPLSEIIASVEVVSHHTITEVEFEGGVWEIEFVMNGEVYEVQVDPLTGETVSDGPVKTGQP